MCIHILDPYIEQPTNVKLYSYLFFFHKNSTHQCVNVLENITYALVLGRWVPRPASFTTAQDIIMRFFVFELSTTHRISPIATNISNIPAFIVTNNTMCFSAMRSWARFLRCEPASISSTFTISANNYPTLRFRSLAATQPGWAELCICLLCPRGTETQRTEKFSAEVYACLVLDSK